MDGRNQPTQFNGQTPAPGQFQHPPTSTAGATMMPPASTNNPFATAAATSNPFATAAQTTPHTSAPMTHAGHPHHQMQMGHQVPQVGAQPGMMPMGVPMQQQLPANLVGINPSQFEPEKRITIWNKLERRKISGNAAPMGKNLVSYLAKHPECEVFTGQDKDDPVPMPFGAPSMSGPFSVYSSEDSILPPQQEMAMQPQPHMHTNTMAPGGPFMHAMAGKMGQPLMHHHHPPDQAEKRVTIWHKTEKRKISGNAAPMEKNLRSYLATHPECEVYVCQDKAGGGEGSGQDGQGGTFSSPVPIPELSEDAEPFEESRLTPVQSFDFESKLEKGIPIRSPNMGGELEHMMFSPMSPVDSLASSFNTMDFSMGSHQSHGHHFRHGRSPRMHGTGMSYGNTPTAMDLGEVHHFHKHNQSRTLAHDPPHSGERSAGERERSSTMDEFGVMGKLEGF